MFCALSLIHIVLKAIKEKLITTIHQQLLIALHKTEVFYI